MTESKGTTAIPGRWVVRSRPAQAASEGSLTVIDVNAVHYVGGEPTLHKETFSIQLVFSKSFVQLRREQISFLNVCMFHKYAG